MRLFTALSSRSQLKPLVTQEPPHIPTSQDFNSLWEEALEEYIDSTGRTPSEQELLKQQLKTPDDLRNQLETDHGKFTSFREKHGKLTGRLKNAAKPLMALSDLASSAIGLSPFAPASTIFGAITFVVKAADGVSEAYDWIDQLFDKLRDFTVRLDVYCEGGTRPHLETKLVQILACLLEILARSEKAIKIGRWKKYAAVLFLGKDEKIKASFEKLAKLVDDEQRLIVAITFAINQRMDTRIEEIGKAGNQTLEGVKRAEMGLDVIQKHQRDQLRDKILNWISSDNFSTRQSDFIGRREEGTGLWFLNTPEFETWVQGSKQTLFCPGMPGAGKTIMAAIAIDHLSRAMQNDDIGLAYLFCNYNEQVGQTASMLLSALLKQLVRGQPDIATPVTHIYDHHSKRGTRPASDEVFAALQSVCSNYAIVYIVVDALDECSRTNGTRGPLIDKLRKLQIKADVRLLFTSRFIPEIAQEFQSNLILEVRASEGDTRRFIAAQIPRLPNLIIRDKELRRTVENEIVKAVDGMFLLASLHVDSLLDKRTKQEVLSTLKKLSEGSEKLHDAYNDAIKRIDGQLENDRLLARRAISWITYGQRPLRTEELRHALAIKQGDRVLNRDAIYDIEDVISVCAGLVTVDEESSIVRLVHYTTQEYFEHVRLEWNSGAREEIAVACLTYLSFDNFRSGSCATDEAFEQRLAESIFFDYLAHYWSKHIRPVETTTSILALAYLCDEALVDSTVQAVSVPNFKYTGYSKSFPNQSNGLHLTAGHGLLFLTEKLLKEKYGNHDIGADSKNEYNRTPLSLAAEGGHEAVVRLLVDTGKADIDSKSNSGRTPLSFAAGGRHEAVVRLLVDTGKVDIDSKDKSDWTPLSWAAAGGHESVVRLLVDTGKVDIDSKDNNLGQTPLSWAAEKGHEAVVKLLVDTGKADIDSKDKIYGQTPLSWAAKRGQEAVVMLLVDTGKADIDSKSNSGRTPLSLAAEGGHEAVVRLLESFSTS